MEVSMVMVVVLVAAVTILLMAISAVTIVPQSQNYVVERFGKYRRTLEAGLNFVNPIFDRVSKKLDILERQLPEQPHDVITKDNVTIAITNTIFFKIVDASKATYRIHDLEGAINNAVTGTVRSIIGSMEFDEVQSQRTTINQRILEHLIETCVDWGVDITRTEILDVDVDVETKRAMQQQLNAERERRAAVMEAKGAKESAELKADAELYTAQKDAEAKKLLADADAYATKTVAEAINNQGGAAIEFEIKKRQVEAMSGLALSGNTKLLLLPNDVVGSLTSLASSLTK
jgi:regulator of protease activity HflC (stomatin/prohibitin superfamily)